MRVLAGIGFTLAGLALAAPTAVKAQSSAPDPSDPGTSAKASSVHKHRKSLFGRSHLCVECQRAQVKARDGVVIPPPPAVHPGPMAANGTCTECGSHTVVATVPTGVMVHQGHAPMMASAPAQAAVGGDAGYAVVGNDPTPIGVVAPRMAMAAPAPGGPRTRDASVGMSSYSPSTVKPSEANRPHVLSHLLGVSAIGRDSREARARQKGSTHAAISYGTENPTVNDLPSRMVYGRGR